MSRERKVTQVYESRTLTEISKYSHLNQRAGVRKAPCSALTMWELDLQCLPIMASKNVEIFL